MQQLTIEHKKIPKTTDQKVVENKIATKKEKDRREGKGQLLAISRNVFRILNSDTYYVESETNDNIYYFVRYEPSFTWCSYLDNSTRHIKCKHIFAIEYAIMKGTLIDVEKLPKEAKLDNIVPKFYRDDDYDF